MLRFRVRAALLVLTLPALVVLAPQQAQARTRSLTASGTTVTLVTAATSAPLPECDSPHAPFNPCGYAEATVTLSGLAAYPDAPVCTERSCPAGLTGGSAELRLRVLCADGSSRRLTKKVRFGPEWESVTDSINPYTRVDANTATLTVGSTLVEDEDRAVCGSPAAWPLPDITLVSATLRRVELHFDGGGSYPSMEVHVRGAWTAGVSAWGGAPA